MVPDPRAPHAGRRSGPWRSAPGAAPLFEPTLFTIGAAGQPAQAAKVVVLRPAAPGARLATASRSEPPSCHRQAGALPHEPDAPARGQRRLACESRALGKGRQPGGSGIGSRDHCCVVHRRFVKETVGERDKTVLSALWDKVLKLLPDVTKLVESTAKIVMLFT